ncbi:MAG: hypothetical protein IPL12_19415 [Bacteroidetes bacterium]|nr:hypothetical protein [Bacteroidota bacterium]
MKKVVLIKANLSGSMQNLNLIHPLVKIVLSQKLNFWINIVLIRILLWMQIFHFLIQKAFDWAYYFFDTDSVLTYENELGSFLIIPNQPFYCNGFSCNVIGLLVLGESSQGSVAYYFNTEFVDKEKLIELIIEQTLRNGRLAIPVKCIGKG